MPVHTALVQCASSPRSSALSSYRSLVVHACVSSEFTCSCMHALAHAIVLVRFPSSDPCLALGFDDTTGTPHSQCACQCHAHPSVLSTRLLVVIVRPIPKDSQRASSTDRTPACHLDWCSSREHAGATHSTHAQLMHLCGHSRTTVVTEVGRSTQAVCNLAPQSSPLPS